jgi:transposase-like protein
MTNIQLKHLIDDRKCYETIREMRWPAGTKCPTCGSGDIKKRGFHSRQAYRQRYVCHACQQQFDDLSGTIFEGHHQPLRSWILCLYLMGLNLSNEQIAQELDLSSGDVQAMTSQLRAGIVAKKSL